MPVLIKSKNPFFTEKDTPEWVDVFFRGLAVLGGLLVVPPLLFLTFWGYSDTLGPNNGGDAEILITGVGISLLFLLVLWRQFHLKRWACVLSTVAAWGIAGIFVYLIADAFLFNPSATGFMLPEVLTRTAISLLFAWGMTTACHAGWRSLEPGF